jgi:hypothetical protein
MDRLFSTIYIHEAIYLAGLPGVEAPFLASSPLPGWGATTNIHNAEFT